MSSNTSPERATPETPKLRPLSINQPDPETLRDIIANDHFGGEMPPSIVEAWVMALQPGSRVPLPPNVKGFYGGGLRASMPIEIARGSYKFITHETADKEKIEKCSRRMLTALSIVDIDEVSRNEPTTGVLTLWHKVLALVRLPDAADELLQTFTQYKELRPKSSLPDSKLPLPDRLKGRLLNIAEELGNTAAAQLLSTQ
ncbi:hypothetical protein Z517_03327 [Fonsecaea pedrosoi CBS 271.37]|uniref:Uncharacterized protein n=1 Tax=Fonsecaea pedrosoi CBS 271.37 TaxID=1442368 RepID=A0A0D2E219_9EURO|nr:uncharacterized protein Z517_03327 [Fonsecaea pedrosoi CBS 271.37]KIW84081.1 hypothetical protein Z517_03327 [Fonsecaea pedrosoi CBS 271.37]